MNIEDLKDNRAFMVESLKTALEDDEFFVLHAKVLRGFFLALCEQGFTEDQAMKILLANHISV